MRLRGQFGGEQRGLNFEKPLFHKKRARTSQDLCAQFQVSSLGSQDFAFAHGWAYLTRST